MARSTDARATFLPEFELALDCCGLCFGAANASSSKSHAEVDWPKFLQLAQFHRIQGLASKALPLAAPDAPAAVVHSLKGTASEIAAENLLLLAKCRELLAAFHAAQVPVLFVKGLTLGAMAYGSAVLKSAIDIDILIGPGDLDKTVNLLRACGFELLAPAASLGDGGLQKWHRHWKESVWASKWPPIQLDLHTRLADNPRLIPGIDVHSPRQVVDLGNGVRLPTLATEELFAYLAVHGASSAWFRLKWISDFAGFVHNCGGASVEQLYRRSQELGAGRAAGQALLLAHALFGTLSEEPALVEELSADPGTRRLFHAALQLVAGEPGEPTERRWGTLPIHLSQFSLIGGAAYRFSELSGQLRRGMSRFF